MAQSLILLGFNPDPSICQVGGEYYIATSTFEWYPGVQIHHSTDLVTWRLVTRPLWRADQLDMRGNPYSCWVWAPCLSWAEGRFWLVYTYIKRLDGAFKDAHSYIVTCETSDGEWSERVYVNSSGFDPSLFHDDDGRKWVLNMRWNHRGKGTGLNPAQDSFDAIKLREWHPERGLVETVQDIFIGSDLGLTQAPHLFRRDGWYCLTTAEGGTGYDHSVTLARSRSIAGPYTMHPATHVLTAQFAPEVALQRVGHRQYVETPEDVPQHTYLCGRPLPVPRGAFCALGRETGLARCEWRDGWLYLYCGGLVPPLGEAERLENPQSERVFTMVGLPAEFQWFRTPYPERLFILTGSALCLTGRESIGSRFEQVLVARRQEHQAYDAAATVLADPPNWQQAAGLITYCNGTSFIPVW